MAEELHDVGASDVTVEDVVSEWQRPSYDVATSTLGVFDGDRLVAYADLVHAGLRLHRGAPGRARPRHRPALADWLEALPAAAAPSWSAPRCRPDGAADRLLAARGYRDRWTAWDLELPEGAEIAAQPLPDGHVAPRRPPGRARGSSTR